MIRFRAESNPKSLLSCRYRAVRAVITRAWKRPPPRNGATMLTPPRCAAPASASRRCTAARDSGRLTAPLPPTSQDRDRTRRRSSSTSSSSSGSGSPDMLGHPGAVGRHPQLRQLPGQHAVGGRPNRGQPGAGRPGPFQPLQDRGRRLGLQRGAQTEPGQFQAVHGRRRLQVLRPEPGLVGGQVVEPAPDVHQPGGPPAVGQLDAGVHHPGVQLGRDQRHPRPGGTPAPGIPGRSGSRVRVAQLGRGGGGPLGARDVAGLQQRLRLQQPDCAGVLRQPGVGRACRASACRQVSAPCRARRPATAAGVRPAPDPPPGVSITRAANTPRSCRAAGVGPGGPPGRRPGRRRRPRPPGRSRRSPAVRRPGPPGTAPRRRPRSACSATSRASASRPAASSTLARSSARTPDRTCGPASWALVICCSAPGRSPETYLTRPRLWVAMTTAASSPAARPSSAAVSQSAVAAFEPGLAQVQQAPPQQGADEVVPRATGARQPG